MAAKNLRQFEFKLGKLGLMLFTIGMAILVFAGFLLGVQVGRNIDTYPEMIARGIPGSILSRLGLSPTVAKRDVPVGAIAADPPEAPPGGPARGAEGEKEGAVIMASPTAPVAAPEKGETAVAPLAKSSGAPSAKLPTPAAVPSAPQKAMAKAGATSPQNASPGETAVKKVPPEKAAPEKAPPEKAAPDKNGKYAIQVVAFREKEKAENLSRKIKALGYSPKVSVTDVSGKGQWYRVTVESFETKGAAEKAAGDMTQKIKGLSCVVRGK